MSSKPPTFYGYALIAFGLVIFAISLWAMITALNYYQSGQFMQFFVYAVMGSVGMVLALSSITQMRRRMTVLQTLAARVLSVVICASCGFKVIRTFSVGDFVSKDVGQCQQCKGTMRVDTVYAEETKKP